MTSPAMLPKVAFISTGGTIASIGATSLELQDYGANGVILQADEITARTPRFHPRELDTQPLLDTAEPQLVALAGSHFVEAIVAERAIP